MKKNSESRGRVDMGYIDIMYETSKKLPSWLLIFTLCEQVCVLVYQQSLVYCLVSTGLTMNIYQMSEDDWFWW